MNGIWLRLILSLLACSTTRWDPPGDPLSVPARIVDISAAAADAPSQATPAPAPAPAALSVSALPLLSPTDALAAALRGQDIPTSRQLTPDEVLSSACPGWRLLTHTKQGLSVTTMLLAVACQ